MQVRELGHIVLSVKDMERSVHFYRDLLGFKEVSRFELGGQAVMFSAGRTHHELLLLEADEDAPVIPHDRTWVGLNHFALKIGTTDDELRAAVAELNDAGVTIEEMTDHWMTHSVYFRDPDGNHVEIYIDVQPELWRQQPAMVGGHGDPLSL
jgi:catechol-2,3-dioxygenase